MGFSHVNVGIIVEYIIIIVVVTVEGHSYLLEEMTDLMMKQKY